MRYRILDTINKSARVIFYPSSCQYSEDFQTLPYDAVNLNSNGNRQPGKYGKVYCLNLDNNKLLGLFAARDIRLSAMVIIRDGCVEGGNYECVASDSFFGRLMPVMREEFNYFTDHNRFPRRTPASFCEVESPIYLKPFVTNSCPLDRMRSFRVTARPLVECDFVLGRIRVTVVRDTIWGAVEQSDYMVINIDSRRMAVPYFVKGRLGEEVDTDTRLHFVSRSTPVTSIQDYLRLADKRKLARLSFMPIARHS